MSAKSLLVKFIDDLPDPHKVPWLSQDTRTVQLLNEALQEQFSGYDVVAEALTDANPFSLNPRQLYKLSATVLNHHQAFSARADLLALVTQGRLRGQT